MSKRRRAEDGKAAGGDPTKPDRPLSGDDSGSSDEDTDLLNVDFEWFDPQPQYDFHGLKTLLRQLLDVDAQLFDLSALADLILEQPLLGSTVKVDGNETDPYGFLTVLNLREHRSKPVINDLISYVSTKAAALPTLSGLPGLLSPGSASQVGLILSERLINIPSEVVPPLYTMIFEEIAWAVEESEPYQFTHYLILSKTYTEVASTLDVQDDDRPQKKKKSKSAHAGGSASETFFFHPEDEVLARHAVGVASYDYTKEEAEGHADSKRAFQELGIKPQGHMLLIEADKFAGAVHAVQDFLKAS